MLDERGGGTSATTARKHLTLITANVAALRPKVEVIAHWNADVLLLQETKVSPATVGTIRSIFRKQGKELHHGLLCKAPERRSRKVAAACKEAARGGVAAVITSPRAAIPVAPTQLVKDLRATGRWEEVLVPASGATTHLGAATIYGVSGASKETRCYRENEAILSKAIRRVIEMGDVPYVLMGDINIDPSESEAVASAVEAGVLIDVGFASKLGQDPDLTYRRSGPFQGMTAQDEATSRLDVCLANPTAAAAITSFKPRWDLVCSDHVPLEVELELGTFVKDVYVHDGPRPIRTDEVPKLGTDARTLAYNRAEALFGPALRAALREEDLDRAHATWSNLAEAYIEIAKGKSDDEAIRTVTSAPNRTGVPRFKRKRLTPPHLRCRTFDSQATTAAQG